MDEKLNQSNNEEESFRHFQTEFLGPQVPESEPGKNRLLQGPEKITEKELTEEESSLSFNFANNERRVDVGYNKGKPFLQVEFYSDLPNSLSAEEGGKFNDSTRIINGRLREVHILRYGDAPVIDESADFNPHETGEFHVAEGLDYNKGNFEKFALNNRPALEQILKKNMDDERLAGVVVEQLVGFVENGKEVPPEILNIIPKDKQSKIREQVQKAVEEEYSQKPEKIDAENLAELIKGKRVIFYTGAGISIASKVPGMKELKDGLGIDTSKEVDGFTQNAAQNPEEILKSWEGFANAAANAKPTKAHKALTKIAEKLKCQVLTANVDSLHEQTGIKPIHTTAQWQKEGIRQEWLKDIDVVIVVGMSVDFKGFLGWYKENNPDGKIIALDLKKPPYLSNEDYLLEGDVQETLPEAAKKILKVKKEKGE